MNPTEQTVKQFLGALGSDLVINRGAQLKPVGAYTSGDVTASD
jgi:hypothetical protein